MAVAGSKNPFLFIVGCPRSGTTLLQRIVDAHPRVAILRSEQHWIVRYWRKRTEQTPDGRVTPQIIPRLFEEHHVVKRLKLDPEYLERVVAEEHLTYTEFVARLFDLYGASVGKELVGDKTPGLVRNLSLLHELWPGAKLVHLIRDGRDVCLSATTWSRAYKLERKYSAWREDPVTGAALWWRWTVRLGREAGLRLGPHAYHEVRYESLMEDAETESRRLCDFLGVDYSERMLAFHEGRSKSGEGRSAKKAWLPVTAGLRDWRTQMPGDDVRRFEASAGDLLDELGYERRDRQPTPEDRQRAGRIKTMFNQDVHARHRVLPADW